MKSSERTGRTSLTTTSLRGGAFTTSENWQSGAWLRFQTDTLIGGIGRLPHPAPTLRSVIFLPLSLSVYFFLRG